MKLFKKIFGKNSKKEFKEYDLGNGVRANSKGEIYGEIGIKTSLNGKEYSSKVPINTTIDKLSELSDRFEKERIQEEQNRLNPNSCEREPNDDEVMVRIDDISGYMYALPYKHPLGDMIFEAKLNTIGTGFNNIVISKQDFSILKSYYKSQKQTYELLTEASNYEKSGDIDLAIESYHKVISIGYNGGGYNVQRPYDRLMILYRKKKDIEREESIIRETIEVLSELNKLSADRAIKEHPEKEDEILSAVPLCHSVMGDNGFYIYNPYDIPKYQTRLEKLLSKKK